MVKEEPLPIDPLREAVLAHITAGPVVVTASTGAGKSTQVPRWCRSLGRVLVVEPRRVACRGLAQRVAELEGCPLGEEVGYSVRDDHRANAETAILFATPGKLIQWLAAGDFPPFDYIILDEFHERRQDMDLLLALISRKNKHLLVMSATLDGKALADHLGGRHLHASGRQYPVQTHYLPGKTVLPDSRGLTERLLAAVATVRGENGDILVFLPGKAEIAAAAATLQSDEEFSVLTIHGGLTLAEQSRIFKPARRRRIILATNVAETSITVPRIGVVVDSGLVRQTRYHNGRGFLTLVPIAGDSADQRRGRAGRLGPGTCYRLWSESARLAPATPPEIHRQSLAELVLAAAACGAKVEDLPFLDPPRDYAITAARQDLQALGALDQDGRITRRGTSIFGLPLDATLANLIVEGEKQDCLADAIDLAAALATGRRIYTLSREFNGERQGLPETGCDATLLLQALRGDEPEGMQVDAFNRREAATLSARLRAAWGLAKAAGKGNSINRKKLALTALAADPRSAYIPRRRRGRTFWSNGGTEAELGRETSLNPDKAAAIIALETRALGAEGRKKRLLITYAIPVLPTWLSAAGLGAEKLGKVLFRQGRITARVQRIYAGHLLEERKEIPTGAMARVAICHLVLANNIFPGCRDIARERLAALALAGDLQKSGQLPAVWHDQLAAIPPGADLAAWYRAKLEQLGVECVDDLELLTPDDLLPPALPTDLAALIDRTYPRRVNPGGAPYRVDYDLKKKEVTLTPTGQAPKQPPSLTLLPTFTGFRIRVQHHSRTWVLQDR